MNNRRGHIEGVLAKGPYPPCWHMADRALLAGYPRIIHLISTNLEQPVLLQPQYDCCKISPFPRVQQRCEKLPWGVARTKQILLPIIMIMIIIFIMIMLMIMIIMIMMMMIIMMMTIAMTIIIMITKPPPQTLTITAMATRRSQARTKQWWYEQ